MAKLCRAKKRVFIGQKVPTFVPCAKQAREGFATCWHHRAQESKSSKATHETQDPTQAPRLAERG